MIKFFLDLAPAIVIFLRFEINDFYIKNKKK